MREPIPFYGLYDMGEDEPVVQMTQADVALVLGVSRQTVNNIEQSAFKKIRRELFKRGINKDDVI
jgi:DNA-directed RNA polymerase sigma subunit (sigma70/sigma32)